MNPSLNAVGERDFATGSLRGSFRAIVMQTLPPTPTRNLVSECEVEFAEDRIMFNLNHGGILH